MSFQNAYLNSVMDDLRARYAHEPEYLQAVEEFLEPLSPVIDSDPRYEQQNIVGRMAEPRRLLEEAVLHLRELLLGQQGADHQDAPNEHREEYGEKNAVRFGHDISSSEPGGPGVKNEPARLQCSADARACSFLVGSC